jgi:hypothetical protein
MISMKPQSQDVLRAQLREHTIEFSKWFNEASSQARLGVLLDPTKELKRISLLRDMRLDWRFSWFSKHKVSRGQVQTAVEAIAQSIANPGSLGFVLGGRQSERTDLAMLMLFAIPAHYLTSNVLYTPLLLTSNRNSEQMRALGALTAAFTLYGDINIGFAGGLGIDIKDDPHAESYIAGLREGDDLALCEFGYHLAEEQYPGGDRMGSFLNSAVVKMRPGKIAMDVTAHRDRAKERGHEVILIVEEARSPLIGADGKPERKMPCPLSRALTELGEDFLSPDNKSFMVGFAEKPMANLAAGKLWAVNMKPVSDKISTLAQPA